MNSIGQHADGTVSITADEAGQATLLRLKPSCGGQLVLSRYESQTRISALPLQIRRGGAWNSVIGLETGRDRVGRQRPD